MRAIIIHIFINGCFIFILGIEMWCCGSKVVPYYMLDFDGNSVDELGEYIFRFIPTFRFGAYLVIPIGLT